MTGSASTAQVSDEQLRTLIAADPSVPQLLDEMRARVRQQVLRRHSSREGLWRGRPVMRDERNAHSNGGWIFKDGGGYPPVETWDEIQMTPDPRRDHLRPAARTSEHNLRCLPRTYDILLA